MLRFKAYFMEAVPNSRLERERARIMTLSLHISDNTLRVYEPPQESSGLYQVRARARACSGCGGAPRATPPPARPLASLTPARASPRYPPRPSPAQGEFAKKHVPQKPDGSGPYGPLDFALGAVVHVSGRDFVVVDADADSRVLLRERYGVELGAPLAVPRTYVVVKDEVGHRGHANKVSPDMGDMEDPVNGFFKRAPDTKGQFMEHGSNILRFECEWRETGETFGDRRSFALQYYLSDDTMELLDKTSAYSQGGAFTKFAARQRMPRMALEVGAEAVVTDVPGGGAPPAAAAVQAAHARARAAYRFSSGPTVWPKYLNPITGKPTSSPSTAASGGAASVGGFAVLTAAPGGADFVTAGDLVCGGVISIFGRPLLLRSCDPFTVAFGLQKLGIDQRATFLGPSQTPAAERAAGMPQCAVRGPVGLPPFVGALAVGVEEETRVNASKIVPTFRYANNFDRFYQLAGKQLRFEAALDAGSADPDDAAREFVVSFYLEDDSMAIVEVMRDKKGARAVRFLARGRWRNARGAPERAVQVAVQGAFGDAPLPPALQRAYDRVYAANGDQFGYADSFNGQGYSGGIFGKAERTGPGGTGVGAGGGGGSGAGPIQADLGIRDPLTHAYQAPPPYFAPGDFYVGAPVQMHHLPGLTFVLGRPDGFTASYLASREGAAAAGASSDARNVFVPDSPSPVPSLPLERCSAGEGGAASAARASAYAQACLLLARLLSGVMGSAETVCRQADKGGRGYAPRGVVEGALASYGVTPASCPGEALEAVLGAHCIGTGAALMEAERAAESARSRVHARRGPGAVPPPPLHAPGGGSPLSTTGRTMPRTPAGAAAELARTVLHTNAGLADPFAGPHLTDFGAAAFGGEEMVDYRALFAALQACVVGQQSVQPRTDKLLPQLRAALLSTRKHLRDCFRDLNCSGEGVVTFKEFRHLLLRHQLDVGMNDAAVREVMRRFPPAQPHATDAAGEPLLSYTGFVEALLDSATLAPGEMEHFWDFVRGVHNREPESVGGTFTVPQVFPHVNKVSSWGPGMDLSRFAGGLGETRYQPKAVGAPLSPARGGAENFAAAGASAASAAAAAAAASGRQEGKSSSSSSSSSSAPPPLPPPQPAAYASARPSTAALPLSPLNATLAPAQPRPATAPSATHADPRPAPAQPAVDVYAALSAGAEGKALLERLRAAFGSRRLELYRSLTLYDTRRQRTLGVRTFLDALVSAGLRLSASQCASLTRTLCQAAGAGGRVVPHPQDVVVQYEAFLDSVFPPVMY